MEHKERFFFPSLFAEHGRKSEDVPMSTISSHDIYLASKKLVEMYNEKYYDRTMCDCFPPPGFSFYAYVPICLRDQIEHLSKFLSVGVYPYGRVILKNEIGEVHFVRMILTDHGSYMMTHGKRVYSIVCKLYTSDDLEEAKVGLKLLATR